MFRKSTRLRPSLRNRRSFEILERRDLLASDFLAAIEIETLDANAQPISQVEVGESFVLRVSAKDLRSQEPGLPYGVFAAFADFTFDGDLAVASSEIEFSERFTNLREADLSVEGRC